MKISLKKLGDCTCGVPTENNTVGTRHCRLLACHSGVTGIDINRRFETLCGCNFLE